MEYQINIHELNLLEYNSRIPTHICDQSAFFPQWKSAYFLPLVQFDFSLGGIRETKMAQIKETIKISGTVVEFLGAN